MIGAVSGPLQAERSDHSARLAQCRCTPAAVEPRLDEAMEVLDFLLG
jgi:hypothetical protein